MPSAGALVRCPDLDFVLPEGSVCLGRLELYARRKPFRSSVKSGFELFLVGLLFRDRFFVLLPEARGPRVAPANIGSNQSSSISSTSWVSSRAITEFNRLVKSGALCCAAVGVDISVPDMSLSSDISSTFRPKVVVDRPRIFRATPFWAACWTPGDPFSNWSLLTGCDLGFAFRSMLSQEAGSTPLMRLRSLCKSC
jgi:hypothetical protein